MTTTDDEIERLVAMTESEFRREQRGEESSLDFIENFLTAPIPPTPTHFQGLSDRFPNAAERARVSALQSMAQGCQGLLRSEEEVRILREEREAQRRTATEINERMRPWQSEGQRLLTHEQALHDAQVRHARMSLSPPSPPDRLDAMAYAFGSLPRRDGRGLWPESPSGGWFNPDLPGKTTHLHYGIGFEVGPDNAIRRRRRAGYWVCTALLAKLYMQMWMTFFPGGA